MPYHLPSLGEIWVMINDKNGVFGVNWTPWACLRLLGRFSQAGSSRCSVAYILCDRPEKAEDVRPINQTTFASAKNRNAQHIRLLNGMEK